MLKDRVAVVTGAARGMGKQICLKMAGYGADIVALDLDEKSAQQTADEVRALGRRAVAMQVDVSSKAQVDAAFAAAVKEFGKVDILSNNAGICIPAQMTEVTEAQWDKSFAVNCKGAMFMCQAAGQIMKKNRYGRIIVTASQSGKAGEFANGPYCVSKATIAMMMQVLTIELSQYGILANSISPGYTDTTLFRNGMADRAVQEGRPAHELIDELMSTVPIRRPAQPEEIAELVCFLASEKNSYVTGTDILIAGGNVMY
ncbi:SDR family oxidoreductase [Butyricicoccus faecihominis]|uniref:SDR family NAD(P)-dependent oxidoreductase n=1 Tax=Butyricicoccus faecihominis TaxID=1712515 RepID=UPI002479E375|nr:SDR family NAD(P)-dependent oxidoreductase [Butyricicoccus faecihominis]MCQ5129427.1 SDR family oxidoreductase [Butyricicoccus faecihominis]